MKHYIVVLAVVVVLFIFVSLVSVFGNDIIWNDDQTSIDVRSKLMVQVGPLNVII